MPVRQETNARFLVQVSIKSQNERKSKWKLLWAEKSAKWRSRYISYNICHIIYMSYNICHIIYVIIYLYIYILYICHIYIMTYYNIHCQTANVYGFPYKPLMAKRINRCQSLPSGKAHPAQTDEHRCAHQRVQGHKWNGHFQRCLSWLRRLLGSAMFSLWNGIFGPTQPTHLKKSIKFHDFGWFWMILGCSSLFKSIYRHVSGSHCKCKAATVSSNTWIWRNACKSFFWTKLCKFAMRSQCFFKAENLSVSVFFLTIKQLQHLESYLPSVNSWNCHLRQDAASFGLRVDSELGI